MNVTGTLSGMTIEALLGRKSWHSLELDSNDVPPRGKRRRGSTVLVTRLKEGPFEKKRKETKTGLGARKIQFVKAKVKI